MEPLAAIRPVTGPPDSKIAPRFRPPPMVLSPFTPIPRAIALPPILALVLEGLRPEDLSRAHSPFLDRMRRNALIDIPLRTAPGEQCWGEVFAGVWPERTGALAPWTLDPTDRLPLGRGAAWLRGGMDLVLGPTRRFLHGRRSRKSPPAGKSIPAPPFAPPGLRRSLRLVDDPGAYLRPGRATLPTLFDSLVAAGCRTEMTAFPTTPWEERKLISRLGFMSRAFLDRHDLYLARLPGAERLVLSHGPGSPERHQLVRDLDGLVERLVARFRRQYPHSPVLIASVRGSVAAQTYFDAGHQIRLLARRYGLLSYRDYALMVNRTLVRFWALSPAARSVLPLLEEEGHALRRHGTTLTPEIAARHHLPPPGVHAGDWIWFAHPGVIAYPNDCDAERPRAATGYLPEPAREGENESSRPPQKGVPRRAESPRETGPDRDSAQPEKTSKQREAAEMLRREMSEAPRRGPGAEGLAVDHGFLILSAPELDAESTTGGRPAWRADLCVTLAKLLDVRVPAAAQGRSLLKLKR